MQRSAAPWAELTVLLLVVGATAVVRTRDLGALGISSDEAVYVGQGRALETGSIPEVRAHTPLLGALLGIVPKATTGEVGPRTVAVVMGLLAVVTAGLVARELAGRVAGVLAALTLAAMPYHADVTRLALVEVPMASAVAVATLLVVVAVRRDRLWLVEVAAVALGVATLFKETAVVSALALAVSLHLGVRGMTRRRAVRAATWYIGVVVTYPAYLLATGGLPRAVEYLRWQVQRGPANGPSYAEVVLPRMGWGVLLAAGVGAVAVLATRRRGGLVVVLSAAVPAVFYMVWPVDSYPYPLVLTVPVGVLAGCGVVLAGRSMGGARLPVAMLGVGVAALTSAASAGGEPPVLPGSSGVPAMREAAMVLTDRQEVPVVTAAPWVANILLHYLPTHDVSTLAPVTGSRARHNPAYRSHLLARFPDGPVAVVWDAWSADTDPAGTARLLEQVRERGGRVTHTATHPKHGSRALVVVFLVDSTARHGEQ